MGRKNVCWWQGLERDVLPALYEAAAQASAGVLSVDLDIPGSEVRVGASGLLLPSTTGKIEDAVCSAGSRVCKTVAEWKTRTRRPDPKPYTTHFLHQPQARRFTRSLETVSVFDIRAWELVDLRTALADLLGLAAKADVVGAVASGGLSPLEHLAEADWRWSAPLDPREHPRRLPAFARRYHLFPGLGWEQGRENSRRFSEWLKALPAGSSVLLLDTGTKGHGVRKVFNQVKEAARMAGDFGPRQVRVVGLIDGDAQGRTDDTIRAACGKPVTVSVEYRRVPRVLSEDCGVLTGYEPLRTENVLLPVRDNGLIRILDADGRSYHRIVSTAVSANYRALLTNPPAAAPAGPPGDFTPEGERAVVEKILRNAMNGEYHLLNDAWCWGLLSDRCAQKERQHMPQRYQRELERYKDKIWDFKEKEMVRRRPGEQ